MSAFWRAAQWVSQLADQSVCQLADLTADLTAYIMAVQSVLKMNSWMVDWMAVQ
jgi:hypothetical protein